ncbi:hypothetical protein F0562_031424 [Nyssa sinensis]|uniref:Uncharacterized protein n=1 Tax=Nyssa sinensis TaxID=561372 RepID=A0A5J5AWN0_9ASTE|nr:hypothetical protein F0562_031424 [Nyssa sinensis]
MTLNEFFGRIDVFVPRSLKLLRLFLFTQANNRHSNLTIFNGLKAFGLRPLTSPSRLVHESHALILRDDDGGGDDEEEDPVPKRMALTILPLRITRGLQGRELLIAEFGIFLVGKWNQSGLKWMMAVELSLTQREKGQLRMQCMLLELTTSRRHCGPAALHFLASLASGRDQTDAKPSVGHT